jgi:hypothetical protein
LFSIEDSSKLTVFESRPRKKVSLWNIKTQSPISGEKPLTGQKLHFLIPNKSEAQMKKELPLYSDLSNKKYSHSLIFRSRNSNIEKISRELDEKADFRESQILQDFCNIRQLVDSRRIALTQSIPQEKDDFLKEIRVNQIT